LIAATGISIESLITNPWSQVQNENDTTKNGYDFVGRST